ncbi:MAG TPA: SpoIID/LytB domain-containing protein [Dissulfurispiraceae bacterium]|nr:SpoIID/LytB domain-containing protein [Dissulfurispiraceae bacterium]
MKTVVHILCSLLLVLLCSSGALAAEQMVRVLLLNNGIATKPPQKGEELEQLGSAKGDVLLGGLRYSGMLEIWRGKNGLYVINELPLEEYVKGVVAGEVGKLWDAEALKAQAVAARTYTVAQRKPEGGAGKMRYDLTSTVLDQVYKGGEIPESIAAAVEKTRGEILTFDGRPIIAFYHSTSGGMTEDAAEVFGKSYQYLRPVETNPELSPFFIWQKQIPIREMEQASGVKGLNDISVESFTVSGRVRHFAFTSGKQSVRVVAKDLRKNLGWDRLPSTFVTGILRDGDVFVIEGRGYGHGVGMCQYSALQMAKEGKTYREILSYFYSGTTLQQYEKR